MTWEQWQAPAGRQFLIGDIPVLFNEYLGLGDERAELIRPVPSDTALKPFGAEGARVRSEN